MPNPTGAQILMAIYAFAFQVYGDFAGYSNIARGISRLMGFDLMVNFKSPYFAINPSEFWKRWHISLSSWLRDFLYIPLGGNRRGRFRTCVNIMVTMLLGGLWHGAAWTYVIWGFYQGSLLIIYRLIPNLNDWSKYRIPKMIQIIFYFHLTCLGWLFFRSNSLHQAGYFFSQIFLNFQWDKEMTYQWAAFVFLVTPVLFLDFIEEYKAGPNYFCRWQPVYQCAVYGIMFLLIYLLGNRGGVPFIYFQF
jgi:alginate O-acetyltransferase complex protein AlgI